MKETLYAAIDAVGEELCAMADDIFDHPELDSQEVRACGLLSDYLSRQGFAVEVGVGGKPTAFRAVYEHGQGGPSIGLLCEYDALEGVGHACGHHLQGPAICGAAVALRKLLPEQPFRVVVYGTPAEEMSGGKIVMLENGCFRDIDIALMMHGYDGTFTDTRGLSSTNFTVTFHGVTSHAAVAPEQGRSALDALLLSFHAIEFLREHVLEDTRMHYTVLDAGGPSNVVPAKASGDFSLRSYNGAYLQTVIHRFYDIVKGAALMTGTTYEIEPGLPYLGKVPVGRVDALLMDNAVAAGAENLRPPREKTGSTDFGNLLYQLPGSCIGVAFAPPGSQVHTRDFVDAGKSPGAHRAVLVAAKTLAGAAWDLIETPALLVEIQEEFRQTKAAMEAAGR